MMATSAPDAANLRATASPTPLLPPVTMAARPARLISIPASHLLQLAEACVGRPAVSPAVGRACGRRFQAALRRARLARDVEALIEIGADRSHQRLDLAVEEMVGAGNDLLVDHDALLGLELVDEPGHVLVRHNRVFVAVNDEPRGGAGGEEREIIEVGGR